MIPRRIITLRRSSSFFLGDSGISVASSAGPQHPVHDMAPPSAYAMSRVPAA